MMSEELLLQHPQQQRQQQADSIPLQYDKETEDNNREKKMLQDLEQEIECPRCYDIMSLSSDFNGLCYFCQECNLSLLMQ
jgi:late competence protein required for DNA uptake (superfamily II DNA/RNA helicase)